jgi:hypothetical protein
MACSRFADALKARALGAPLGADAAAHLAVCSACQTTLEAEERLLATIGQAVGDVGSVKPAPDFVSRLRVHVERTPRWTPGAWLTPAIVATAAVLVAVVAAGRLTRSDPEVHQALAPQPVQRAVETRAGRAAPGPVAMPPRRHTLHGTASKPRAGQQTVAKVERVVQTPEVLVPVEQWRAVGRLFESLRAGRPEVVSALMSLQGGRPVSESTELTIAPIRIEPVVVSAFPSSTPIFDK